MNEPSKTIQVSPSAELNGSLTVPGDKSVGHRALMLGALCEGVTEIENVPDGADNHSTRHVLRSLGVQIEEPSLGVVRVHGRREQGLKEPDGPLDCGNSGTTMRLMAGLLAGQSVAPTLTGDESLSRRPMARIISPLTFMGAKIEALGDGDTAPLRLDMGAAVQGTQYQSPVASAQVKSAVLLAGLRSSEDTVVVEPAPSRDHTERLLRYLGFRVESSPNYLQPDNDEAYVRLFRPAVRVPRARPIVVPGDISSAAFFLVAAALIDGSDLTLKNISTNPTRTGILDVLQRMGVPVEMLDRRILPGNEPVADLRIRGDRSALTGIRIDGDLIPRAIDELPIIAVLATAARGETVIAGAGELRVKESDRIKTTCGLLDAAGAAVVEEDDGLKIAGGCALSAFSFHAAGDHRLAMAAAVAALTADGPCEVQGAEACAVSYPSFFEDLAKLTENGA